MTGRRPTGTRGDAPLWRDEPGAQGQPGEPGGPRGRTGRRETADHPVPPQRTPHRERRRTPGPAGPERGGPAAGAPAPAPAPDGSAPRRQARREGARTGAAAAPGANRMPAVLPALGLPVLGALADELLAPGLGPAYAACAVLGAALAALVSSRAGWWWVVSGAPVVTLAVAGGVDYLARGDRYRGAGLGTEGLKLVSGQFPWMLAALAAALLAVGVRTLRARRPRRG